MAKRALLVGINRYAIPGSDLRGCVNDVKQVSELLVKRHRFRKGDITTLLDRAATTRDMRKAVASLVRSGRRGDVLLFHYSGHGSNVPDKNGDEADHRDEILCPADLDWGDPFLDDWMRSTFDGLRAGVNLTVILDCCHSGTATRAIAPPDARIVPRYLPCPLDLMATESGRNLRGSVRGTVRKSSRATRRRRDVVNVDIPEVLITGCRDTQTSADAYIRGSYHGALTWSLVGAHGATPPTYRDLHARTKAALARGGYDQVPQLEGRAAHFDLPFLASRD